MDTHNLFLGRPWQHDPKVFYDACCNMISMQKMCWDNLENAQEGLERIYDSFPYPPWWDSRLNSIQPSENDAGASHKDNRSHQSVWKCIIG